MKLAYLLSEYPTLVHTYLLREVRELRALGWEIQTVSIRRPEQPAPSLSSAENQELASTWYILGSSTWEFLKVHASTLLQRPLRYLTGLSTALRFGRYKPRNTVLAVAYFAEAVLAGHRLHKAGFTRVHSVYTTTVGLILARVFPIEISMTIHGSDEFIDPEGFRMEEKIRAAMLVTGISYFGKSQIMRWLLPRIGTKSKSPRSASTRRPGGCFLFENILNHLISLRWADSCRLRDISLLLEALAMLTAQGRNACLTFVGDGPDRSRLQEYTKRLGITNHVVFAGWRGQEELLEFYRRSDLCVLSSFAEGVPVVLMEAMALGVPCVAPRITGIPELIRHGIEGILVTPANVEELAAAIAEVIDKPEVRRSMAAASREWIARNYDLRKTLRDCRSYLSSMGGREAPRPEVRNET